MENNHAIQSLRSCFHCGLPISENIDITVKVDHHEQSVCCFGCKAVCELIMAGGLDNYYKYRTEYASKKDDEEEKYIEYDNPDFQHLFCSALNESNNFIRARLIIDDIHCAACVWLIENGCKNISGIDKIKVNLVDGVATLDWDNNANKLSTFIQRIADLGYKVSPWSENNKQIRQEKSEKQLIRRTGLAGIVMMQVGMFSIGLYAGEFQGIEIEYQRLLAWFSALLTTPVLLYSAQPFYASAWRSLKNMSINMDVPVAAAITLAYVASMYALMIGPGEIYFDSICMFVFLLLGVRYLDLRARNRLKFTRASHDILPLCRRLIDKSSSTYESVPIHTIQPGDILMVRSGESIPVDGKLVSKTATLNEASISGEFLPVCKVSGSELLSGATNNSNSLVMKATKRATDSWLQSVQNLAFDAQQSKPEFLKISDKVARYFSLIVLLSTCAVGSVWYFIDSSRALEICIAMLVISCPCALSLAAPSALTVASNYLREQGVLICNGNALEKLSKVSKVCFDKTGTLTKGEFSIIKTHLLSTISYEEAFSVAASLEAWSEHPIADAFANKTKKNPGQVDNVLNIQNAGVSGYIHEQEYRIGSLDFCEVLAGQPAPTLNIPGHAQCVWLTTRNSWLACFELNDTPRQDAGNVILSLKQYSPTLLTGDTKTAAQHIANQLGMDHHVSTCTPQDKQAYISRLQGKGETVIMIGDGVNDLPVLAQADVSVAINSANALAKNEADCILLNNNLNCIPQLFSHAKATFRVIRQNITWALAYNFGALPLAAAGLIPPWAAAIGMSASSLVVILNATKLRKAV